MDSSSSTSNMSARDKIRAGILGTSKKPHIVPLNLFGQDVELRQPTLQGMMTARSIEDTKDRLIAMILLFVCVPGTNERVFEEGDRDDILNWPFGEDLMRLNNAIVELTGVSMESKSGDVAITQEVEQVRTDPLSGSA